MSSCTFALVKVSYALELMLRQTRETYSPRVGPDGGVEPGSSLRSLRESCFSRSCIFFGKGSVVTSSLRSRSLCPIFTTIGFAIGSPDPPGHATTATVPNGSAHANKCQ